MCLVILADHERAESGSGRMSVLRNGNSARCNCLRGVRCVQGQADGTCRLLGAYRLGSLHVRSRRHGGPVLGGRAPSLSRFHYPFGSSLRRRGCPMLRGTCRETWLEVVSQSVGRAGDGPPVKWWRVRTEGVPRSLARGSGLDERRRVEFSQLARRCGPLTGVLDGSAMNRKLYRIVTLIRGQHGGLTSHLCTSRWQRLDQNLPWSLV